MVSQILQDADQDGDGTVNLREFASALSSRSKAEQDMFRTEDATQAKAHIGSRRPQVTTNDKLLVRGQGGADGAAAHARTPRETSGGLRDPLTQGPFGHRFQPSPRQYARSPRAQYGRASLEPPSMRQAAARCPVPKVGGPLYAGALSLPSLAVCI